jgi:predicted ribosome quality control (RQC) complex YloA/Tae2 family protein
MDYFSLKAATAEVKDRFRRRKILETKQISSREAVLKLGKEEDLLLSIDPERPGLFILTGGFPARSISSPFSDLLAARISGSIMTEASIPDPGERVVLLSFEAGWPAKPGQPVSVVLEVMGRHSNLAVLEDGKILQPIKAVPVEKSPVRPFLSGGIWKPPPPRPGIPPEEVGPYDLPGIDDAEGTPSLLGAVRGLSPHTAGQVLMRVSRGNSGTVHEAVSAMLDSADGSRGWLHCIGGKTHLCPFEPVIREDKGETIRFFTPFSAASARWREEGTRSPVPREDDMGRISADLERMEDRLTSSLAGIDRERERCSSHEEVRTMAEALLINASGIPPGAASVSLPNPYEPDKDLSIDLDPSRTPLKNAERLFEEARRLKRGLAGIPSRVQQVQRDLSAVVLAREALRKENDPGPAMRLLESGKKPLSRKAGSMFHAYRGPGRKHIFEGYTILVGRNGADNERVTFQAAGPHDMWLHARDYAGSHVVILSGKGKVPEKVILHAAALAAEASGARNDSSPEIMVTERKWVRKLKGGKPGKVTVQKYRSVTPRR